MKRVALPESVTRHLAGPREIIEAFCEGLRPDPIEWVWEWAERERRLSTESSAMPGPYRINRTPYLRDILEDLSPHSPVERVVFKKSAQIGASELANCFIAYVIAKGLGPTLLVQATEKLAKDYSKQRLDPMIRDTPRLREILGIRSDGTNDANQLLSKAYPGGVLFLAGAESAKGLRSKPIRNLILDEVDAYPRDVEGEGDPCDLAIKRTDTFARRKILEISTPTVEGDSRISSRFEQTDKRYFFVPCPSCGTFQRLVWKRIVFDRSEEGHLIPESVKYSCEACGELIGEEEKADMVAKGEWRATATAGDTFVRGYSISAFYSPWRTWAQIAQKKLEAGRNPQKLKTWTNVEEGEPFAAQGEAPEWATLWRRREPYDDQLVPAGALILTAGVDAQQDRLEMEVVGWGPRLESWSLERVIIDGDTATAAPYEELGKYLRKAWPHENGGQIGLTRMFIDAGDGSYSAQSIHRWARPFMPRVMPCRGRSDASQMVYQRKDATLRKGRSRRGRLGSYYPVGVGLVKAELYGFLRLPEPAPGERMPDGYCHFPRTYDEEYFIQLTSERVSTRPNSKGIPTRTWKVIEGRRNEMLDCRVYARAAAFVSGIDGWSPERWEQARQETLPADEAPPRRVRRKKKPKAGGYLGRRDGWLDSQ